MAARMEPAFKDRALLADDLLELSRPQANPTKVAKIASQKSRALIRHCRPTAARKEPPLR